MKITLIISTLEKGGSERVSAILASSLVNKNLSVQILTMYDSHVSYPINNDVKILSLGLNRNNGGISIFSQIKYILFKIRRLGNFLKTNRSDVIIAISSDVLNAIIIITKVLYNIRSKIILTIRSNPIFSRKFMVRKIIYFFFRYADKIVVQTNYNFRFISKYVRSKKIKIIPNPLEIKSKNYYFSNSQKKYDFLCVGRLNNLKNQRKIILALKSFISTTKINAKLCFVGRDDGEQAKLLDLAQTLNLENNIIFAGERDDIHMFYENSKIFIHFSNYEGMSNAVLEAQSYGLPSIISNHDGIEDIIEHMSNGIIVDKNSSNELFIAILKLYNNEDTLKKLSVNSFSASKNFAVNKITKKWISLF